jgi:hypothetical protein
VRNACSGSAVLALSRMRDQISAAVSSINTSGSKTAGPCRRHPAT